MPTTIPTNYRALSDHLGGHLRAEQGALDAYRQLIEDRPDDVVSYLVGQILVDEERHHQVFVEIQNSLESMIRWEALDPRVPSTHVDLDSATRQSLLETTEGLIALEREDLGELRQLRRAWERSEGDLGLWAVLVKGAELDTEKHITVLNFLRRLLGDD